MNILWYIERHYYVLFVITHMKIAKNISAALYSKMVTFQEEG
jgi:hypothetical protein